MTRLVWPNGSSTTEPIRSDDWGWRTGYSRPFHTGQDWYSIGSLKAIGAATVVENHWGGWAGWQVLLHLGSIDGVETWARYCHLASQPALPLGTSLAIGATVGQEGNTGESEGNHLHLEIYQGAVDRGDGSGPASTVNPRTFIRNRLTGSDSNTNPVEEVNMSNPIVNVKPDTVWIGRADGTFEKLDQSAVLAMNTRGIISHVFLGLPNGNSDIIPSVSAADFAVVKKVWEQMCRGR
ncbi:peptidoglycan DD-metalloendopeptidase family protein [Leucobacter sp. UT-8R-CII-1-4]|uniref:M23 family metallopeptidase n=1 Tax=Leucobacter sp. UT-8R-CII-1-4 TaxID=3040075 RepID=UPI0024A9BB81|nr:peptidoglycan DD-metalloendopeptidase family protein [Leucobacter sp. UT-8R-CII-1-4]MDI6023630.1 peptidoglycan DD-metalloendopeptidase family protein [Leucobacter sp. UT-8R-CII-1-4]